MSDEKYVMGHMSFAPDYGSRKPDHRVLRPSAPIHFADCAEECEIKKGKQVKAAAVVTCTWCRGWMAAKGVTIPRTNPHQHQLFKERV